MFYLCYSDGSQKFCLCCRIYKFVFIPVIGTVRGYTKFVAITFSTLQITYTLNSSGSKLVDTAISCPSVSTETINATEIRLRMQILVRHALYKSSLTPTNAHFIPISIHVRSNEYQIRGNFHFPRFQFNLCMLQHLLYFFHTSIKL